jgi:hypothetical protein
MLRQRIGDENWWRGIRDYYRRHRNSTATVADFQRDMEAACDCELTQFLDYWLRTGSTVLLDGDWQYDADAQRLRIDLERSGDTRGSPALELQAALYFEGNAVPEIVAISIDERGGSGVFEVPARPRHVILDPNTRLLAAWNFRERRP